MFTLTPPIKSSISSESGFTLLEIIAVLVIMSILAVVAVPKFFDLQEQAKIKALESGHAEAISRVNSWFAREVLSGKAPEKIDYTKIAEPDMGDFEIVKFISGAAPESGNTIVLEIKGKDGTPVAEVSTIVQIQRPGL